MATVERIIEFLDEKDVGYVITNSNMELHSGNEKERKEFAK
jgi:hypothetical protein